MKKNILICLIILLVIIIIFFLITKNMKTGSGENYSSLPIDYINLEEENENIDSQEQEQINQIKENQGLEGNQDIYEIATEYDGRQTITIKSAIKYKVAISGILKKDKPEFTEIEELLTKAPTHTGIWISESSRDKLLQILNNITKLNYTIDEDGYLHQEEKFSLNKYDKKIKEMLSNNKLYVFEIASTCYIVDEVTGEIQEYPFEEMDPYTECEYFETKDKAIYIISENNYGKMNQEETLKEILENIE